MFMLLKKKRYSIITEYYRFCKKSSIYIFCFYFSKQISYNSGNICFLFLIFMTDSQDPVSQDNTSTSGNPGDTSSGQKNIQVFDWQIAFQTWSTDVKFPEHTTEFNEEKFIFLLAHSLSLAIDEKINIIDRIPDLSQSQIDQLLEIFVDEQKSFADLEREHPENIRTEREKRLKSWENVSNRQEQNVASEEDESKADDIRKQLGL
jgi:hypothetical protein